MNFEPPSAAASSARVSDAEQRHHVECAEPAAAQLLELSLPLSPLDASLVSAFIEILVGHAFPRATGPK